MQTRRNTEITEVVAKTAKASSGIGRLSATLPEPIKRARDKYTRGFAGEGNVVEWSERYASETKPEEPKDSKRRAWAGLLGDDNFLTN